MPNNWPAISHSPYCLESGDVKVWSRVGSWLACLAHMIAALPMRRAEEPLTLIAAASAVVARRSETVLAALRESGAAKVRSESLWREHSAAPRRSSAGWTEECFAQPCLQMSRVVMPLWQDVPCRVVS